MHPYTVFFKAISEQRPPRPPRWRQIAARIRRLAAVSRRRAPRPRVVPVDETARAVPTSSA